MLSLCSRWIHYVSFIYPIHPCVFICTKPELQILSYILIFMIQSYLQDWVSGFKCDRSVFNSELLTSKTWYGTSFLKLDLVHQQKAIIHASVDHVLCWGCKEWSGLLSPFIPTYRCRWSSENVLCQIKFMHLRAAFFFFLTSWYCFCCCCCFVFWFPFSLYLNMLHRLVHSDSPLVSLRNCYTISISYIAHTSILAAVLNPFHWTEQMYAAPRCNAF